MNNSVRNKKNIINLNQDNFVNDIDENSTNA